MPDITPEESRELKSRDLTPPMSDMNDRDRQAFEKWYTSSRDYSQESIAVIAEEAYAAAIAHARQQDAERERQTEDDVCIHGYAEMCPHCQKQRITALESELADTRSQLATLRAAVREELPHLYNLSTWVKDHFGDNQGIKGGILLIRDKLAALVADTKEGACSDD